MAKPFDGHSPFFCHSCLRISMHCRKCGNNTCNGGSGNVNGAACPDCDDAHAHDQAYEESYAAEGLFRAARDLQDPTGQQFTALLPGGETVDCTDAVQAVIAEAERLRDCLVIRDMQLSTANELRRLAEAKRDELRARWDDAEVRLSEAKAGKPSRGV